MHLLSACLPDNCFLSNLPTNLRTWFLALQLLSGLPAGLHNWIGYAALTFVVAILLASAWNVGFVANRTNCPLQWKHTTT
jgi:hypothetical protein